jgi:hypothetical protein
MKSARHSDINTAKNYERDAVAMKHLAIASGEAFPLTPFKSIFVENVQVASTLTARVARGFSSLYESSRIFVEETLNFNRADIGFSISRCIQTAVNYKAPKSNIQQLKDFFTPLFGPHVSKELQEESFTQIERYVQLQVKESIASNSTKRQIEKVQEEGEVDAVIEAVPKKKRLSGELELQQRSIIKHLKTSILLFNCR